MCSSNIGFNAETAADIANIRRFKAVERLINRQFYYFDTKIRM